MILTKLRAISVATLLLAVLAACQTTEEKAEQRYQEALELLEEGETERAMVSLRNVFRLNGQHRDARMLYAEKVLDGGNVEEAISHYRLVVEQFPTDVEARVALGRLALDVGVWSIARDEVEALVRFAAEDPRVTPLQVGVDYADAIKSGDAVAQREAAQSARDLLQTRPDDALLMRIDIDALTRERLFSAALDATDDALEQYPLNPEFNQTKLNLLATLEDLPGLGEHLQVMVDRFPENQEIRTALVRWYVANDDVDSAEEFVRGVVAQSGDDLEPRIALVQFLLQLRGTEAALAELDRLIDEGIEPDRFRLFRATIMFDSGDRDTAISTLRELIEGRESDDTVREIKTTLARMLIATGSEAEARALVDEVLAADEGNTEALKLRASWLIETDQVRDAVLALRTALDQSPTDAETLTLLAQAYERGGNRELMAESLSRAVDASNAAPDEAKRFARYLVLDEKYLAAENVLLRALRQAASDLRLLQMLGQVYLEMNELPRAEQVVQAVRQIDTQEAQSLARGFEAAILQRMQRTDESIQLMQAMIEDGQASLAAKTAIVRTRLSNGELGEARRFMDQVLAETPADSPDRLGVDFLNAALTATEGDYDAAKGLYRDILAEEPEIEAVWRALVATIARAGDLDEAVSVTDEALAALPSSTNLRWIKAGLAERAGQMDEALAIYEELYAEDSSSTIIANNLASIISTYRTDEENLQRAFVIARRLRGTEVPAFQDTYGWITFRLGNVEEALEYLEPAAAGLPNNPAVQYHLAKAYEASGQTEAALEQFERAFALWQDSQDPIAVRARSDFAAFKAARKAEAGAATEPAEPAAVTD